MVKTYFEVKEKGLWQRIVDALKTLHNSNVKSNVPIRYPRQTPLKEIVHAEKQRKQRKYWQKIIDVFSGLTSANLKSLKVAEKKTTKLELEKFDVQLEDITQGIEEKAYSQFIPKEISHNKSEIKDYEKKLKWNIIEKGTSQITLRIGWIFYLISFIVGWIATNNFVVGLLSALYTFIISWYFNFSAIPFVGIFFISYMFEFYNKIIGLFGMPVNNGWFDFLNWAFYVIGIILQIIVDIFYVIGELGLLAAISQTQGQKLRRILKYLANVMLYAVVLNIAMILVVYYVGMYYANVTFDPLIDPSTLTLLDYFSTRSLALLYYYPGCWMAISAIGIWLLHKIIGFFMRIGLMVAIFKD